MMAQVKVLQPGLFSTIQDLGRTGFMEFGVPRSGSMDLNSARLANLCLNNPEDSAVLEITQMGPKLRFSNPVQLAICGASLSPKINERPIEKNKSYTVQAGEELSFGSRLEGCRAYLAISGGFQTEKVLKSRSWYKGVTEHERLEKGMKLNYLSNAEEQKEKRAILKPVVDFNSGIIEVFQGPEFHLLTLKEQEGLLSREFLIDKNNNRMAIQLQEPFENHLDPMITGPVLPGTVQLTPSGKLIVLMRDCQTTGGYPRILQLSEEGMCALSQKHIGEGIFFLLRPEIK